MTHYSFFYLYNFKFYKNRIEKLENDMAHLTFFQFFYQNSPQITYYNTSFLSLKIHLFLENLLISLSNLTKSI